MADHDQKSPSGAQQVQQSQQSAQQGAPQQQGGTRAGAKEQTRSGIGASQRQDRGEPDEQQSTRPSAGTADIERRTDSPDSQQRGGNSEESLVQESTGAFKERP